MPRGLRSPNLRNVLGRSHLYAATEVDFVYLDAQPSPSALDRLSQLLPQTNFLLKKDRMFQAARAAVDLPSAIRKQLSELSADKRPLPSVWVLSQVLPVYCASRPTSRAREKR